MKENSDKVSAVIVNYNGENYLREAISALKCSKYQLDEILIVDNNSQDKSLEVLSKIKDIKVIKLKDNLGPGKARNIGIDKAKNKLVILIDNDVIVDKNWLLPLIKQMKSDSLCFACLSRTLYFDNPKIIQNDGQNIHYLGFGTSINYNKKINETSSSINEIGGLSGISVLIDKTKFNERFDEKFHVYVEDLDWTLRMRSRGYNCYEVPSSKVYHKGGTQGYSFRGKGVYPKNRLFLMTRNRWFMIIKDYDSKTLLYTLPLQILYEIVVFGFSIMKLSLFTYVKAHLSLWFNLPYLIKERKRLNKVRKVSTKRLLESDDFTFVRGVSKNKFFLNLLNSFFKAYWRILK